MIFINDLNLEVSGDFLFLYLKCTGVYRQLARRIFLRQSALGEPPHSQVHVPLERVQEEFDLFRMNNGILSRRELDALLDVFGLQPREMQDYLSDKCQVEQILTEKIRNGEFPDRSVLLEMLFDEECRRLLVQASAWETVAGRTSQAPEEERACLEQKARDKILAMNDIGDWDVYCDDLKEMGLDQNDIQRFISTLAKVEYARLQGNA